MLSPQVVIKGLVGRLLPKPPLVDGPESERAIRLGRYGDVKVESHWPGNTLLADEGAIMVATTLPGATALQLGISAAFSATAAAFTLANSDPAGGVRLYPLTLKLSTLTAPTSGVDLRYAIVLDSINRAPTILSSGSGQSGPGTPATATAYRSTVSCANQDLSPNIAGIAYFPLSTAAGAPPTVPAPSAQARTIAGNGFIKGSIPVAKDQYTLQFGGTDYGGTFQAAAALAKIVEHVPPIVIGPGQFMTIHIWSASNITAGNAWDDVQFVWAEL